MVHTPHLGPFQRTDRMVLFRVVPIPILVLVSGPIPSICPSTCTRANAPDASPDTCTVGYDQCVVKLQALITADFKQLKATRGEGCREKRRN